MSESIAVLFLIYRYVESVFCLFFVFLGIWLWKIVRVGKWSERGGEMVPAVIRVSVRVVRQGSMSVAVL